MPGCWIALGGNVGAVADTFQRALDELDQTSGVTVVRGSRHYTTSPVGTDAGSQFINAAAELETSRNPLEMLGILQAVEIQLGRIRALRWGPRTLDLDLLLYDQQILTDPILTVPHPHLWYRRFVLDPLAEIAPDLQHPQFALSIAELQRQLLVRPLPCSLSGSDSDERHRLQSELAATFPETTWNTNPIEVAWLVFNLDPHLDPGEAASLIPSRKHSDLSIPPARAIQLNAFPTPPLETIRDVLHAALDAPRVIG